MIILLWNSFTSVVQQTLRETMYYSSVTKTPYFTLSKLFLLSLSCLNCCSKDIFVSPFVLLSSRALLSMVLDLSCFYCNLCFSQIFLKIWSLSDLWLLMNFSVFLFNGICYFHLWWKFSKMARYDMSGIGINLREVPDDNGDVKLKVLGLILDGPAHAAGIRQVARKLKLCPSLQCLMVINAGTWLICYLGRWSIICWWSWCERKISIWNIVFVTRP